MGRKVECPHCRLVCPRPRALRRHAPRCRMAPLSLPVRRQDDSWMAEQLCSVSPAPEEAQVDNLLPPPLPPVFTAPPSSPEFTVLPPPSSLCSVSPAPEEAQVDNLVPPPLSPAFTALPPPPETTSLPPAFIWTLVVLPPPEPFEDAPAVAGQLPANFVATSTVSPPGYSYTPPAHLSAAPPTCGFASTPPPLDHTPSPPRTPRAGCTITADVATQTDAPAPRRNLRRSIDRPHLRYLQPYPSRRPGVDDYGLLIDVRRPRKMCDCATCTSHMERILNDGGIREPPITTHLRFVKLPLELPASSVNLRRQLARRLERQPEKTLAACGCDACHIHRTFLRAYLAAFAVAPQSRDTSRRGRSPEDVAV